MKNSGFATRVASAIVLVILILAAGIIGNGVLLILLLAASTIGLSELYKALGLLTGNKSKDGHLYVVAVIMELLFYGVVVCVKWAFLPAFRGESGNIIGLISKMINDVDALDQIQGVCMLAIVSAFVILTLIVFMLIYVFTFPKYEFVNIAYAFTGFVYVVIFMSFTFLIRCLSNGQFVFWLIFISSWVCDTFAYLVGMTIGKHKLAKILSPKKSIEGAIGGIAGSILVAFLYGYFIEHRLLGGINHASIYMIICAFGAIVSQIGDLTASGIKRNHEIKDYGQLIPGHGGILDRFDSVIFVAPAIYLLAVILL